MTKKESIAAAQAVNEARVIVRQHHYGSNVDGVLHNLEMAYWKVADKAAEKKTVGKRGGRGGR